MIIPIPFGKDTLQLDLPSERVAAILTPQASPSRGWIDESAVVEQALANPIGTPKLRQLARRAQRVTVITSDHTRPLPSRITLPLLLAEIRAGNPDAAVAILVATGCHRPTTSEEMLAKFGPDLVRNETFIIHDAMAGADAFHDYGPLPSGAPCRITKLAADCDLLVAEGFIEPHFFAGYSGGRKAVLPGVADQATVLANHSAALIDHPNARAGMLAGNLLHLDMVAAARQAKLAFILNVTLPG
ncbi:MAG: nickel-dependent lactate racemase, partial [Planctomycetes bacterium]|nr:nickel-dependent lactate racemase [Planctomycetota bacterium]